MSKELIVIRQVAKVIRVIRREKVLLDFDLAPLYGVTTGNLNKAVRRPYAFTEQGVAMLSSVLSSERAVNVNIAIMRAFVKLREALETNRELARKFSELEKRI